MSKSRISDSQYFTDLVLINYRRDYNFEMFDFVCVTLVLFFYGYKLI